MDDNLEKNEGNTPEDVTAFLRLVARNTLAAAIIIALLYLAWQRGAFFPGLALTPAPQVDRLPLPVEKLRTPPVTVTAMRPHESRPVPRPQPQKAKPAPAPQITAPIPGAYIVVYLSRRALGLVVDGKYVRTFYNLALPADRKNARAGNDGRAPIGDYFVVAHETQQGVQKLRLSYPAPADAARMLAARKISREEYNQIVTAAKGKKLPARLNPVFGGAAYISGDGRPGATTTGDIAVSAGEMRELWAAIADGAVVMIRP